MSLFESARLAHILIGTLVLASFWGAAWAAKGSARHRLLGRVYGLAMAALLAVTVVIAAGAVLEGNPMKGVFNVYVSLISVCSVWMAWQSIRHRGDIRRYLGWPYKGMCLLMGGHGLFLLTVVPKMGLPARMAMVGAFALLGLVVAGAMAWRWVRGADQPRWWLSEHLTAMSLNFGATHASFSILAGSTVLPMLKEPWARTAVLVSWMLLALAVRLWAGRRFMGDARTAAPLARPPAATAAR